MAWFFLKGGEGAGGIKEKLCFEQEFMEEIFKEQNENLPSVKVL